ncbi:MAG: Gfo/Idh/MocA family oxidoreductase [Candidatus Nezhaarchaeales archaeon]
MKDNIKVSVIGVGFWGRNHARVFSELEGVTLESVYDVRLDVAKGIAEKYGCRVAESLDDAIKCSDAVTICTPTSTHFEVAMKVLELEKPLLIEKPITAKSPEALKLIKKANEKNVLLMVGHIERFNMGFKRIYDLVKRGKLGEIISIRTKRVSGGSARILDVGVMLDLAIHDLDLIMILADSTPSYVYSIAGSRYSPNEDYAYIMLSMENGIHAYVEASWLTKRKVRMMEVTGSEGIAELNFLSQEVTVKLSEEEFKLTGIWMEPLKLELENFVKSIKGLEKPLVTGVDGYRALRCAELALEAAKLGRPVKVEFEA